MQPLALDKEAAVWRDPRAVALLLAATLTVMANATISPALPGLESRFAEDPHAEMLTRLLVPAPSLTVALCAPLAGLAADRFGRRWLLLAGMVLFVITGSAGLFLPDLPTIFASRLALGVAVAMIMTAQTALIGDYFTGAPRSAMMGLQISVRNFGGLVFITLAGWLALTSPRLPFAVYALAALFLPFVWASIRDTQPPRHDTAPGGASAAAHAGHPAWRVLILALALLQLTTNMTFFVVPTQLPFFFVSLDYESASMTGAALGTVMLTGGCAALAYGRMTRRLGHAGTLALGFALLALGFTLLAAGSGRATIFAGAAAIGAGYATVLPNFVALALALAPARHRGLAGGILTTAIFLGQFCSPFLSIPAIDALGFGGTFGWTAALLAALALASGLAGALAALRRRT